MDEKLKELVNYLKDSISFSKYESGCSCETDYYKEYALGKCNTYCEILGKMVELEIITEEEASMLEKVDSVEG